MNLDEAKELLNKCERQELRDHAFGDSEVYWLLNGEEVGGGYFSGKDRTVWINDPVCDFDGDEAQELRKCGAASRVSRNDETGPETYSEGVTMPGLTLEGVRKELTGE